MIWRTKIASMSKLLSYTQETCARQRYPYDFWLCSKCQITGETQSKWRTVSQCDKNQCWTSIAYLLSTDLKKMSKWIGVEWMCFSWVYFELSSEHSSLIADIKRNEHPTNEITFCVYFSNDLINCILFRSCFIVAVVVQFFFGLFSVIFRWLCWFWNLCVALAFKEFESDL